MSLIKITQRIKEGQTKPTREYSKKQEKEVAKAVSGRQSKNSGATMFDKSDVAIQGLFNIECKTKTKSSEQMTIHKEWITKNEQEALFMGRPYSAIAFSFGPGEENHYIISEDLFLRLCEVLKNESNE